MYSEEQNVLGIESEMSNTMISSIRSIWTNKLPSVKVISEKIDDIFDENNLEPMSVEILMQKLKELGIEPLIEFFGEIGLLKILKEEEPMILHSLSIDEDNRVVYYGTIPSSRIRRTIYYKDKLHDQLEIFIFKSMKMKEAIERFHFRTEDRRERLNQLALTVLQRTPQVFTLDRLDEEGTIVRIVTPRFTTDFW